MNLSNKSLLAHKIRAIAGSDETDEPNFPINAFVIDGGALLQSVAWPKDLTVGSIVERYSAYLKTPPSETTIVFDGYPDCPTIKDMTHARRGTQTCPDISFNTHTTIKMSKVSFLSNKKNKMSFIQSLSDHLRTCGFQTIVAESDADASIVKHAIDAVKAKKSVCVMGDDTDLLVMLIHYGIHDLPDNSNLVMKSKYYEINIMKVCQKEADHPWLKYILFIHAFLGCDTTSHPYRIGKTKLTEKSMHRYLPHSEVFYKMDSSYEAISSAGEIIGVGLYRCKFIGNLNHLRYKMYSEAISKNTLEVKQIKALCPTSKAFAFHSYRVYLQMQVWLGNNLNPTCWGWQEKEGALSPIGIQEMSPPDIATLISCSCKTGCKNRTCSCRKQDIECDIGCLNCTMNDCSNFSKRVPMEEEDHEDGLRDWSEEDSESEID